MKLPWVSRTAHANALYEVRKEEDAKALTAGLNFAGINAILKGQIASLQVELQEKRNEVAKLKGELTAERHAQGKPAKGET